MKEKKKIGFSVLDIVLMVLVAACVLSTVFQEQIRTFLGERVEVSAEVTFLVEHVTDGARNHPVSGEEVFLAENGISLGKLVSVSENKSVYESLSDMEETIEVSTLTCKMLSVATEEENGYHVSGTVVKPGTELSVETESASFVMIVTMVKSAEEEL